MSTVDSSTVCGFHECDKNPKIRGFCQKHYHAMRHLGQLPPMTCKSQGCTHTVYGRGKGYCGAHFQRAVKPNCSVDGCGQLVSARGFCATHLRRFKLYGDPSVLTRAAGGSAKGKPCCVSHCADPLTRKRYVIDGLVYCGIHWKRMKVFGDPHFVMRPQRNSAEDKKRNAAARHRRYYATPHGKLRLRFNAAKARAIKYGCDWETGIHKEVFTELYNRTLCDICGFFMPTGDRTIDHIVALSDGGPNSPTNLQTVHMACNSRKGGRNRRPPVCTRTTATG